MQAFCCEASGALARQESIAQEDFPAAYSIPSEPCATGNTRKIPNTPVRTCLAVIACER